MIFRWATGEIKIRAIEFNRLPCIRPSRLLGITTQGEFLLPSWIALMRSFTLFLCPFFLSFRTNDLEGEMNKRLIVIEVPDSFFDKLFIVKSSCSISCQLKQLVDIISLKDILNRIRQFLNNKALNTFWQIVFDWMFTHINLF